MAVVVGTSSSRWVRSTSPVDVPRQAAPSYKIDKSWSRPLTTRQSRSSRPVFDAKINQPWRRSPSLESTTSTDSGYETAAPSISSPPVPSPPSSSPPTKATLLDLPWRRPLSEQPDKSSPTTSKAISADSLNWPECGLTSPPKPGQFIWFATAPKHPSSVYHKGRAMGAYIGHVEDHPLVVIEVHGEEAVCAQVTSFSQSTTRSEEDLSHKFCASQSLSANDLDPSSASGARTFKDWRSSAISDARTTTTTVEPAMPTARAKPRPLSGFEQKNKSRMWASRYHPIDDAAHNDPGVTRLVLRSGPSHSKLRKPSHANNQVPFVIEWRACMPYNRGSECRQPRLDGVSWAALRNKLREGGRFGADPAEVAMRAWLDRERPAYLVGEGDYGSGDRDGGFCRRDSAHSI